MVRLCQVLEADRSSMPKSCIEDAPELNFICSIRTLEPLRNSTIEMAVHLLAACTESQTARFCCHEASSFPESETMILMRYGNEPAAGLKVDLGTESLPEQKAGSHL